MQAMLELSAPDKIENELIYPKSSRQHVVITDLDYHHMSSRLCHDSVIRWSVSQFRPTVIALVLVIKGDQETWLPAKESGYPLPHSSGVPRRAEACIRTGQTGYIVQNKCKTSHIVAFVTLSALSIRMGLWCLVHPSFVKEERPAMEISHLTITTCKDVLRRHGRRPWVRLQVSHFEATVRYRHV